MILSDNKFESLTRLLKKYTGKIILTSILFALIVFAGTKTFFVETYTNRLLLQANYDKQNEETEVEAISASKSLASLYANILDTGDVYANIKRNLSLETPITDLRNKLTIEAEKNTPLITITAEGKSSDEAIELSNEILNTNKVSEFISVGKLKIESMASIDTQLVQSSSPLINAILAFILIFLLSWAYVFLKNIFSKTIKGPHQIEEVFGNVSCLLLRDQNASDYDYDLQNIKNQLIIKMKKEKNNIIVFNTFSKNKNPFIKKLVKTLNDSDIVAKYIYIDGNISNEDFKQKLNEISSDKFDTIIVENIPFDSNADSLIPLIYSDYIFTIISQNEVNESNLVSLYNALRFSGFKTDFIMNNYKINEDVL